MFLHVLGTEALTTFVLDYFLQDVCIANSLEDTGSPSRAGGSFVFFLV